MYFKVDILTTFMYFKTVTLILNVCSISDYLSKMSVACVATLLHCPCSDAAVSDVADGKGFREEGPGKL